MKEYKICGKVKKFTKAELIKLAPDTVHFCGKKLGHKGKHKCFYTFCKRRW